MEVVQNVLYVLTQGAYVRRDHLVVQVEFEGKVRLGVPMHNLAGIVLFGQVMVSPGMLQGCAEHGVAVTFLSGGGRLLARVDAPVSGNVLLRREQFRWADQPERALELGRRFVAGKLHNARHTLMRSARENPGSDVLNSAAEAQAAGIRRLENAPDLDTVRGVEGAAARQYFAAFGGMLRQEREAFAMAGRSRRPALDRMNSLLSFLYALLLADCTAALAGAGLDPYVGFLHGDRPGKPSLALDLMEEFRPLLADRLAVTLVNRKQVQPGGFTTREGGAVEMKEATRRAVIDAWRERKQEVVTHVFLGSSMPVSLLFHMQARMLARCIRGDLAEYVPCTLK